MVARLRLSTEEPSGAVEVDECGAVGRTVLVDCAHGRMLVHRHDTSISFCIRESGGWEMPYIRLLKELLAATHGGMGPVTVVDAGANMGVYSVELARVPHVPTIVHAIEAQRLIYQMLNANLALNSIDNVYTYHRVLSDVSGDSMDLACPDLTCPANYGAFEIPTDVRNSDFECTRRMDPESVRTMTLDSLGLERCGLIKIDVEGMEDCVLRGAVQLLKRDRPSLFFERHKTDYSMVLAMLHDLDYDVWELPEQNSLAVAREFLLDIEGFERLPRTR